MISNLGLHVIKFPSGKYGFVGNIPLDMASMVPASTSAVMGGRAIRNEDGKLVEPKWPVFEYEADAINYAKSFGHSVVGGEK